MSEQVDVEVIAIPSKRDQRLAAIHDSARAANEIAKERRERTKQNREKYGKRK